MKITQITENISHTSKRLHDIEKEKGVKPGTPEWFKLWFSLPYLKESITEAFDNPYPYTWDSTQDRYAEFGNDSFLAKAEMDMGELMVMFTLGKPGVSWTIDFAVDGSMDKTGDGDQFRIFATVVAVIKDWMANKVDLSKVTQIDFSSDKDGAAEDSRSKLYKRFSQQLASKLGWNLEVTDRGQFASFKIKNPNAPVEEAVNEATEMKISDLTISDAGMAIAQSAGGGSRTDAPLSVTKLPSGYVYLLNGYHRLVDAMNSGKDTVSVEYVPYEKVAILWKNEREQDIKYGKQFNEEVEVSLHGDAKKGYTLSKIKVSGDERNAGQGTKAMQDIVDRMDREGAIIALTPDDAFGGNKNRLIKFYKRFGFVPNKGRNKDFRFRETMIRYPQTNEGINEGYKLQLERDTDMMVLNITDTVTGKRTEVRGKAGYETNGYDANDKLHKLLDKISKSANISELMNGEVVGINPKHPAGPSAKTATDTAFNESLDNPYPFELIGPNDSQEFSALAQTPNGVLRMDFEATDYDNFGIDFSVGKSMGKTDAGDEFKVFATVVAMMKKWIKTVGIEHVESFDFGANKGEHASDGRAKLYTRFAKQLASKLGWRLEQSTTGNNDTAFFKLTNPNPVPREQEYWDALEENFKDGKVKGKSRPGRVKRSGASCNGSVTELRAKAKKASGEKAKMYHWCANMKAGKKK
jgi:GNAT superfamily N-acetyltransferase